MSERKYSVSDIDRMRAAVSKMFPGSGPGITSYSTSFTGGQREIEMEEQANKLAWERHWEDKVRTYMLAGVSPEELEVKRPTEAEGKPEG